MFDSVVFVLRLEIISRREADLRNRKRKYLRQYIEY